MYNNIPYWKLSLSKSFEHPFLCDSDTWDFLFWKHRYMGQNMYSLWNLIPVGNKVSTFCSEKVVYK